MGIFMYTSEIYKSKQQLITPSSTRPLAFSYIRFSSKKQELGNSLQRQMEAAERWCAYNNVELSPITFDDLGVSAFKEGTRPALADMLEYIKTGIIPKGSFILLENSDRLSRRGFKHAVDIVHEIVNNDVYLVVLGNNPVVYDKHNIVDLSSMLSLLLDSDRGRQESARKSVLIKAAKKHLRSTREAKGKLPWWLSAVDGKAELNEFSAVIREMVDMKLQGVSAQKIATHFNNKGVLNAQGTAWKAVSINASFKNKLLYGTKVYYEVVGTNGRDCAPVEEVPNWAPAICSKREFDAIQPKKRVKGELTRTSAFTGLLRCPNCHGAMQQRKQYHKGKEYTYRRCLNYGEGRCTVKDNFKDVDVVAKAALQHLKVINTSSSNDELNQAIEQLNAAKNKLETQEASLAYIKIPEILGRTYDDIYKTQQEIAHLEASVQLLQTTSHEVNTISLFDLPNKEVNVELKKVIKAIYFFKLAPLTDKLIIQYVNDVKSTFVITHKRNGRSEATWKMQLVADSTKWDVADTREAWERDGDS